MSKLTLAMIAVALSGCAGTSGWRALRIDGSSQSRFEESVSTIQQELSPTRRVRFDAALRDLWITGVIGATDEAPAFDADDYFAQLDGLGYKEVVGLADSTVPSLLRTETYAVRRPPAGPEIPASRALSSMSQGGFTGTPRAYPADSNPWREFEYMRPANN